MNDISPADSKPFGKKQIDTSGYRPIKPGEIFQGGMPIIPYEDRGVYNSQAQKLYGKQAGQGKWGVVFLSENKATKIFKDPQNINNAYELVFMKKFGGVAGLPEYYGVVPNGYQMEKLEGVSVTSLIDKATRNLGRDSSMEDYKKARAGILTKEQGQELLDKIAEFHSKTKRVHGDLGHFDDVILTKDGKIRLIDPEWERIGNITPQQELESTQEFLEKRLFIKGLSVPNTISAEEAEEGLSKFKDEARQEFERDPLIGGRLLRFKNTLTDIKIGENGEILVRELPQESTSFPDIFRAPHIATTGSIPTAPVSPPPPAPPPPPTPPPSRPEGPQITSGFGQTVSRAWNNIKSGVQRGLSLAGNAVGKVLTPIVGPLGGKFIGSELGQALSHPMDFLNKWLKRSAVVLSAIAGFLLTIIFAWIAEIIIGIVAFIFMVAIILFIINSGAYVTPQGGFTAVNPPGPLPTNCPQRPPECPCIWPILPEGSETTLSITQGPWAGTHSQNRLEAIDFGASTGHRIYATHDGTVTFYASAPDNYGPSMIMIYSTCQGQDFDSLYAHLSASFVTSGQRVTRGQVIALSGADRPGNDHLHYEFHRIPMAPPNILKYVTYGCVGTVSCNVTIP